MKVDKLKIIVFDLDYTLWPFWVDTHVTPPFKRDKNGQVVDHTGTKVKSYPEVPSVLKHLKEQGYQIGIASRTGEVEGARQLLDLFGWNQYITYKEIYPGCKITHFNKIRKDSNCTYDEMLFFDDEGRNIMDLTKLGVVSILVHNGVTEHVVKEGIKTYIEQRVGKKM